MTHEMYKYFFWLTCSHHKNLHSISFWLVFVPFRFHVHIKTSLINNMRPMIINLNIYIRPSPSSIHTSPSYSNSVERKTYKNLNKLIYKMRVFVSEWVVLRWYSNNYKLAGNDGCSLATYGSLVDTVQYTSNGDDIDTRQNTNWMPSIIIVLWFTFKLVIIMEWCPFKNVEKKNIKINTKGAMAH